MRQLQIRPDDMTPSEQTSVFLPDRGSRVYYLVYNFYHIFLISLYFRGVTRDGVNFAHYAHTGVGNRSGRLDRDLTDIQAIESH